MNPPRSSGDTLSRENFYRMKSRIAEKRLLTQKTNQEASEQFQAVSNNSSNNSATVALGGPEETINGMVKELRQDPLHFV